MTGLIYLAAGCVFVLLAGCIYLWAQRNTEVIDRAVAELDDPDGPESRRADRAYVRACYKRGGWL